MTLPLPSEESLRLAPGKDFSPSVGVGEGWEPELPPLDIFLHSGNIPSEIRSPFALPGGKVWYGDFEAPFLEGRGMGFSL